jgi:hypothetical protein
VADPGIVSKKKTRLRQVRDEFFERAIDQELCAGREGELRGGYAGVFGLTENHGERGGELV